MTNRSRSPVLTSNYQISGNSIWRQLKHWFHMKTTILGYFDTGPGLRNLLVLWVLHYFGVPLFWFRSKLANHHVFKHKIKSMLNRVNRT